MRNNKRLYLQAGGTKGATHAGALKSQQEQGTFVQPHTCCGTSAGALVGSLTAAGVSGDEILSLLKATDLSKFSPANPAQNRRLFEEPLRKTIAMSVLHRLKDSRGDYDTPAESGAARVALMQQALAPDHEIVDPAGNFSTATQTLQGLFQSEEDMLERSEAGGLADAAFDQLFALQDQHLAEARPGDTAAARVDNLLRALESSLESSVLSDAADISMDALKSSKVRSGPANITFADLKDLQEVHPGHFSRLSTLAATGNNDPLISNDVFTPHEPIYAAAMNSGTALGAFNPGTSYVTQEEAVFDGATVADLPVFIDPESSQAALDAVNTEKPDPEGKNSNANKREAMKRMYKAHIEDGMDPRSHENSEFFVFRKQGNAMDQALNVLDDTVLPAARQAEGTQAGEAEIDAIQAPELGLSTRAAFSVSGVLPQSSAFGTKITAEAYRSNSTTTAKNLAQCIMRSHNPVAQRSHIIDFDTTTGAAKGLVDPEAIDRLFEIGRDRAWSQHQSDQTLHTTDEAYFEDTQREGPASTALGGVVMIEGYFGSEPRDQRARPDSPPDSGLDEPRAVGDLGRSITDELDKDLRDIRPNISNASETAEPPSRKPQDSASEAPEDRAPSC